MSAKPSQTTNRVPLRIAHRGASAECPENTLAAFRRALARRADGVELDAQVTADGVAVVFHDDRLRRLTGASGRLAGLAWPALRRLRVGGREPLPRLAEVLRLLRGRSVVQIEIKPGVPVPPVLAAVRTARAEKSVILASFDPAIVAAARDLAPGLPRMLIAERRRSRAWLRRHLAALGAAGLSIDHRAVRSREWVGDFQARGFTVWCWTVNDPHRMRRLAEWGVDAILTDDPALLAGVLKSENGGRMTEV